MTGRFIARIPETWDEGKIVSNAQPGATIDGKSFKNRIAPIQMPFDGMGLTIKAIMRRHDRDIWAMSGNQLAKRSLFQEVLPDVITRTFGFGAEHDRRHSRIAAQMETAVSQLSAIRFPILAVFPR